MQSIESFSTIQLQLEVAGTSVNSLTTGIQNNKIILEKCEENAEELQEVKTILTLLKNYKMQSKREFILTTINTALQDVFDQNIRIDIEATSVTSTGKLNMKYDIVLYQNDIEMARNEKLLGNNGGGVLSFISILFKILVGYIYSDNKFFLFDESISQVSPLYRPRLAKFLKKFCEQYKFTIVLVSQTEDIDEEADLVYLLDGEFDKDGTPTLLIDKIIGTYPEEDYIYSKITNFQSIKELEFRYKGFCVVRGNNNIGKSASFRAINALLFNTFDAKDHPRKNRKRGAEIIVEFGFKGKASELIADKITLSYKSSKVVYEFDGESYAGKSLAFDKVKAKVESIGFKYVNLKETYKNFKGNLKDQTERLAVTTQYDGFYLVGNKANETDKVFNFLFDSTEVANAISTVQQEINNNNNKYNTTISQVTIQEKELIKEKIKLNIYTNKYYSFLILDLNKNIKSKKLADMKMIVIESIIESIDFSSSIEEGIVHYNELYGRLKDNGSDKIKKKLDLINSITSDMESCEHIPNHLLKVSHSNHLNNKVVNSATRISIINDLINATENHAVIKKFGIDVINLNHFNSLIQKDELKIHNIDKIIALSNEVDVYRYYIDAIVNYNSALEQAAHTFRKITNNENAIVLVNELIEIDNNKNSLVNGLFNYDRLSKTMESVEPQRLRYNSEIANLANTMGIEICNTCHGEGYHDH